MDREDRALEKRIAKLYVAADKETAKGIRDILSRMVISLLVIFVVLSIIYVMDEELGVTDLISLIRKDHAPQDYSSA